MTTIQTRKAHHIELAQNPNSQGNTEPFANFLLPYCALPEIKLSDVSTEVTLLNKNLSQPLIISSMTGGSEKAETINSNLAIACEQMRVAFGVGSMRVAIEKPEAQKSFKIARQLAPTTVIFANMGAVQLNFGYTIDHYKQAVDLIHADALYLHLNPLQETLQPEGDTNWEGLKEKIANLIQKIDVPVFVKEVGHGLDPETIKFLNDAGAKGVDVAGTGGTSWSWIEASRAQNQNFQNWFKDFGYPTEYLISKLPQSLNHSTSKSLLIASGGIRNPIQGLKAHLLGADFFATAQPFLSPALESADSIIKLLTDFKKGMQIALFSIGVKNWQEASQKILIKM